MASGFCKLKGEEADYFLVPQADKNGEMFFLLQLQSQADENEGVTAVRERSQFKNKLVKMLFQLCDHNLALICRT